MRDKMSEEREREMVDLLRFENGDFALPLNKTYFTSISKRNRQFRISNRKFLSKFQNIVFSFGGYSNIRKTGKMKNFFFVTTVPSDPPKPETARQPFFLLIWDREINSEQIIADPIRSDPIIRHLSYPGYYGCRDDDFQSHRASYNFITSTTNSSTDLQYALAGMKC
jgi:hypothetical protein